MGQRCKLECRGTGDQVEGVLLLLNPGSRWALRCSSFNLDGSSRMRPGMRTLECGDWEPMQTLGGIRGRRRSQQPHRNRILRSLVRPVAASQTQGGRCGAVSLAATRRGFETATGLDSGWLVEIPEEALGNGRVPSGSKRTQTMSIQGADQSPTPRRS